MWFRDATAPPPETPGPVGLEQIADRPAGYAEHVRSEPIGLLEPPLGRVLDVGCGKGMQASLLRQRGATEVVGIEFDPAFAAIARGDYDEVVTGSVEEPLPWPPASFDTILCYDVLEHLYDPWSVASGLRPLLRKGGRLHASVPNVRHRNVILPLAFRGTFRYEPEGLLDVTHLRFFARADAMRMLEGSGYEMRSVSYARPATAKGRFIDALTRGRLAGFNTTNWYLLATPRASSPAGP